MQAKRVLFICRNNSARSQMAEAYLNSLGNGAFEAHSAGLEPTKVQPLVVDVMKEEGIDLSDKTTRSVFDLFKNGALFEYVITVCDADVDAACPVFPGVTERLLWPFPDPTELSGDIEERRKGTRRIRDMIKKRIEEFVSDHH